MENSLQEKILLAVGIFLVMLRFYDLGNVTFVLDEPLFQTMMEAQWKTHSLALTGMAGSSLPIPYGGAALWFYSIPYLVSSHPMAFTIFHTAFFSLAFLFLYLAVRTTYGRKAAAWAFCLSASSPFLFFFSRHPWDTTLFVPLTAMALWCVAKLGAEENAWKKKAPRRVVLSFLFLTLICAFCINMQLASAAFILALGATIMVYLWRSRASLGSRAKLGLLLVGGVFLLSLPYFFAAYRVMQSTSFQMPARFGARWGDFRQFLWNFQYINVCASVYIGKLFLEPAQNYFYAFVGPILSFFFRFDIFGWIPKISAWIFFLFPIVKNRKLDLRGLKLVHVLAIFSAVIAFGVYQYLNIPMRPHYFFSFWWLVFLGVGAAIAQSRGIWKRILIVFTALTIIVNSAFTLSAFAFVTKNRGTRGMNIGTGMMEVRAATAKICVMLKEDGKQKGLVSAEDVFTQAAPVAYFTAHLPECRGLEVILLKSNEGLKRDIRLSYPVDSETDARLVVTRITR